MQSNAICVRGMQAFFVAVVAYVTAMQFVNFRSLLLHFIFETHLSL